MRSSATTRYDGEDLEQGQDFLSREGAPPGLNHAGAGVSGVATKHPPFWSFYIIANVGNQATVSRSKGILPGSFGHGWSRQTGSCR